MVDGFLNFLWPLHSVARIMFFKKSVMAEVKFRNRMADIGSQFRRLRVPVASVEVSIEAYRVAFTHPAGWECEPD